MPAGSGPCSPWTPSLDAQTIRQCLLPLGLPPRLLRVAVLVGLGWRHKAIAAELGLALGTVDAYCTDLYRLTGAENGSGFRAGLAARIASRLGRNTPDRKTGV